MNYQKEGEILQNNLIQVSFSDQNILKKFN